MKLNLARAAHGVDGAKSRAVALGVQAARASRAAAGDGGGV